MSIEMRTVVRGRTIVESRFSQDRDRERSQRGRDEFDDSWGLLTSGVVVADVPRKN